MNVSTSSSGTQSASFNDKTNAVTSPTKKIIASDFTYDLDAMKTAINSPKTKIPSSAIATDENFDKWLDE